MQAVVIGKRRMIKATGLGQVTVTASAAVLCDFQIEFFDLNGLMKIPSGKCPGVQEAIDGLLRIFFH